MQAVRRPSRSIVKHRVTGSHGAQTVSAKEEGIWHPRPAGATASSAMRALALALALALVACLRTGETLRLGGGVRMQPRPYRQAKTALASSAVDDEKLTSTSGSPRPSPRVDQASEYDGSDSF